jgi:hypothetical protein
LKVVVVADRMKIIKCDLKYACEDDEDEDTARIDKMV